MGTAANTQTHAHSLTQTYIQHVGAIGGHSSSPASDSQATKVRRSADGKKRKMATAGSAEGEGGGEGGECLQGMAGEVQEALDSWEGGNMTGNDEERNRKMADVGSCVAEEVGGKETVKSGGGGGCDGAAVRGVGRGEGGAVYAGWVAGGKGQTLTGRVEAMRVRGDVRGLVGVLQVCCTYIAPGLRSRVPVIVSG